MANETTSSTISELYTEIIAEALFVAQERSIMRGLVKNYTIAGGGKSVEVPGDVICPSTGGVYLPSSVSYFDFLPTIVLRLP